MEYVTTNCRCKPLINADMTISKMFNYAAIAVDLNLLPQNGFCALTCVINWPNQYACSTSSGERSYRELPIKCAQRKKRNLPQAMGQRVQRHSDYLHVNRLHCDQHQSSASHSGEHDQGAPKVGNFLHAPGQERGYNHHRRHMRRENCSGGYVSSRQDVLRAGDDDREEGVKKQGDSTKTNADLDVVKPGKPFFVNVMFRGFRQGFVFFGRLVFVAGEFGFHCGTKRRRHLTKSPADFQYKDCKALNH